MQDIKPISIPLISHFKFSKEDSSKTKIENDYLSKVSYALAVENLMYVMVSTRLNIAQVMRIVNKFMSKLGRMHYEAFKWVLRYLRETTNATLNFGGE